MRCPSCGTENAPDSRFCGGCGARLEPSRVAPTVRLPDDTRLPTPPPGSLNAIGNLPTPAPGSLSYPPNQHMGSIPPTNNRVASIPPTANPASRPPSSSPGTVQHRAGTPPPAVSSPSMSMEAPPRRNTAVIAILLVLDLGLAAAGATLLMKGLAKPKAAAASPPKAELHGEAAASAPTPVATAPGGASLPAPPPAAESVADAKPDKKEPAAARGKDAKRADKKAAAKPSAPLDPYGNAPPPAAAADQSEDVERMAAQSFGSFRSCQETAMQGGPIKGSIRIAFLIQPDGHVDHPHAVVNTTSSDVLALCLEQTIATWTFAPHSGPAASYERPFSYQ